MPTTERDIQALTYLAMRLRAETPGARTWDEPGTATVFAAMKGHNLAISVERVLKHATDPEARTPGAINRTFTPKRDQHPRGAFPPKSGEECADHVGQLPPPYCAVHANDDVRAWYDTDDDPEPLAVPNPAAAIRARLRNPNKLAYEETR